MRALRTVALFILLGAIATTLVAWAFAVLGSTPNGVDNKPRYGLPRFADPGETQRWPLPVPTDWPDPFLLHQMSGRGLRLDKCIAVTLSSTPADSGTRIISEYRVVRMRSGWPMLALESTTRTIHGAREQMVTSTPSLDLPDWLQQFAESHTRGFEARRRLPLMPLWSGFGLNTVFFAITFWLLLRCVPFAQSALRKRRHQCLACGYPIGASSICSDCGGEVPSFIAKRQA